MYTLPLKNAFCPNMGGVSNLSLEKKGNSASLHSETSSFDQWHQIRKTSEVLEGRDYWFAYMTAALWSFRLAAPGPLKLVLTIWNTSRLLASCVVTIPVC